MRALVFTALFLAALAVPAGAQPAAVSNCTSPGDCAVVNTGPCGSLLSVTRDGTITPMAGNDARLPPGVEGVCGFVTAPKGYAINTASPAWCVSDADCSYTVDKCGYKAAVNTAYLNTAQARLMSERRSCGGFDTRQVTEERCVSNTCVVTLGNLP